MPSYPPPELLHLVSSTSTLSRLFLTNIRRFNTAFAFASCGGATAADTLRLRQFRSNGPYTFVVQGQFHHYLGSAQPLIQNSVPRYSQIYFYSGEDEQLGYRLNNFSELQEGDLRLAASMVQRVISREHRYARLYRSAADRQQASRGEPVAGGRLFLRAHDTPDPRRYNATAAPCEVAAIIPGAHDRQDYGRDIVVQDFHGNLRRICENHPSVDALSYPILNPTGECGYHDRIPQHRVQPLQSNAPGQRAPRGGGAAGGPRRMVSKREYTAYRLLFRTRQQAADIASPPSPLRSLLHLGGRLFQQWIVDYACQIEHERLQYQRNHQNDLRYHERRGLCDALQRGDHPSDVGRAATVLSSSFTGGPRYMMQRYLDAMAIVRHFGKPDLFVTFTCNPREFSYQHFLYFFD